MGEGRKNTGVKMRKRFGMRTGKNFCVEGNEINVMRQEDMEVMSKSSEEGED